MRLRVTSFAAVAAALLLSAGCGQQTFIAAALVQTPQLAHPNDPSQKFGPYTALTAWLGTIDTRNPTSIDASKVKGLPNAKMTVAFRLQSAAASEGARELPVAGDASGKYLLESVSEPALVFEPGTVYRLIAVDESGEAFGARFRPGRAPQVQEFGSGKYVALAQGHDLTLTRAASEKDGDGRFPPAFVVVARVDPSNPKAQPQVISSTIPQDAAGILKLLLSDEPHCKPSYTVSFPGPGTYVVTLLAVQHGQVSANAFLGSVALTGTGDAALVEVQ